MTVTDPTSSPVESIKASSDLLRGALFAELALDHANVSKDSEQLLKFHGVYAQDDRDLRRARSLAGEALAYSFMIRVAIPGGRLTTASGSRSTASPTRSPTARSGSPPARPSSSTASPSTICDTSPRPCTGT